MSSVEAEAHHFLPYEPILRRRMFCFFRVGRFVGRSFSGSRIPARNALHAFPGPRQNPFAKGECKRLIRISCHLQCQQTRHNEHKNGGRCEQKTTRQSTIDSSECTEQLRLLDGRERFLLRLETAGKTSSGTDRTDYLQCLTFVRKPLRRLRCCDVQVQYLLNHRAISRLAILCLRSSLRAVITDCMAK